MTAKKSQKGEHNIKKNKIKKCLTNKKRNSIIQHDDFGKKEVEKKVWILENWTVEKEHTTQVYSKIKFSGFWKKPKSENSDRMYCKRRV